MSSTDLSKVSIGTNGGTTQLYGIDGSGFDVQGLLNATLQEMQLVNTPYQSKIQAYQDEQTQWKNLQTQMGSFVSIVNDLKGVTTSDQLVTNSNTSSLTVTADSTAVDTNYSIQVNNVATAQKVLSSSKSDAASPLGYNGTVKINNQDFTFTPNMSLKDVANALNQGNYGINAVTIGGNLILTSKLTGKANQMQFQDGGTVGVAVQSSNSTVASAQLTGTPDSTSGTYQVSVQNLASSQIVSSKGFTGKATDPLDYNGNFQIQGSNGKTESFTVTSGQSLQDVVDNINASSSLVSASIDTNEQLSLQSKTVGQASSFSISGDSTISATTGGSLFKDIQMIDGTNAFTNQIQTAQDAKFTVDGTAYTSSDNTSTAIHGVTLTLNSTGDTTVTTSSSGTGILSDLGIVNSSGQANEVQPAQDASYVVDGVNLTSATNSITNAIQGLTLNLITATPSGEPAQIAISQNTDTIKQKVQNFVTGYNQMIQYINTVTAQGATLQGQTIPIQAKNDMAAAIMKQTDSSLMMYQIGISIDGTAKNGTITFDSSKLDQELANDPEDVLKLLSGTNSVTDSLYTRLNLATETDGSLATTISGLDTSIQQMNDTISKNNDLYKQQQQMLIQKFAQFSLTMGDLSSQQDYLTAQTQSWNSNSNG